MFTRIVCVVLLAMSMAACDSKPKKEHQHSDEQIELLDGQKWTVDKGMMEIITDMKLAVSQFNGSTLDSHSNLASSIKEHVNELTSNCTMKGQAHDELHKWLVPYIKTVNRYNAASELSEAQQYHKELVESFDEFQLYFE